MVDRCQLTLYSRAYCHLCHDMERELETIQSDLAFDLEVLDIDANPVLEARFNELVPVLMHGERELSRYYLNTDTVRAYLAEIR